MIQFTITCIRRSSIAASFTGSYIGEKGTKETSEVKAGGLGDTIIFELPDRPDLTISMRLLATKPAVTVRALLLENRRTATFPQTEMLSGDKMVLNIPRIVP